MLGRMKISIGFCVVIAISLSLSRRFGRGLASIFGVHFAFPAFRTNIIGIAPPAAAWAEIDFGADKWPRMLDHSGQAREDALGRYRFCEKFVDASVARGVNSFRAG